MRPKHRRRFAFTPLLLVLCGSSALADTGHGHPLLADDWLFRLGFHESKTDAQVGLGNAQTGDIPVLDLERLGLDSDTGGVWFHGIWQAPERWSIGANIYDTRTRGDRLSDRELEFGDLTIPSGSGISTDFRTTFYVLNGYYDIWQRPNSAFGVGAGVYALDISIEVQSVVAGQGGAQIESADTLAPLPTFSLYYKHAFSSKLALMADVNYFSLDYDKYDGSLFGARISLDYWFNEHWGIGGGVSLFDIDLTVEESRFDQFYDVGWESAFIYVTAGF